MEYYQTFRQFCEYYSSKYIINKHYLQSCPECECTYNRDTKIQRDREIERHEDIETLIQRKRERRRGKEKENERERRTHTHTHTYKHTHKHLRTIDDRVQCVTVVTVCCSVL